MVVKRTGEQANLRNSEEPDPFANAMDIVGEQEGGIGSDFWVSDLINCVADIVDGQAKGILEER